MKSWFFKMIKIARHQWLTPIILATLRRQKSGRSSFKVSPGKELASPYVKKTHHKKKKVGVLVEWFMV
jgi:DUF1365 family protein